jgi:hypothetical protein
MLRWLIGTFRKETGRDREYGPIVVQGRQLRCNVCAHDIFWAYQAQVHTPLMTFLDLEEWNRIADCAICGRCGFMHWFMPPNTLPAPESDSIEQPETKPADRAI